MWSRWSDIDRMFNAMNLLSTRMDRLLGDYGASRPIPAAWITADSMPKANLYDEGDHFTVMAEIPGFTKENLDIKIQGNYLEISGSYQADTPEGYTAHRVERGATSFNRSFTLPSEVDADKTEAYRVGGNVMSDKSELVQSDREMVEKSRPVPTFSPVVDIYENENEILLHADMPGVEKDRVNVNVDNGTLTISGLRELETRGAATWEEFGQVEFTRSFSVPQTIDVGKVKAELKDGVLRLHLPKSEAAKPKQIEIKAA